MATPKLGLPEITQSQSSKYVTHNLGLRWLETLQRGVDDRGVTSPGSPSDGDAYILGTGFTASEWTAFTANDIVMYSNGGWYGITPVEGIELYVADENSVYTYNGSSWVESSTSHDRSHAMTGTSDHTATNWRLFHSNGSGEVVEIGFGESGNILESQGASAAPSFVDAPYQIAAFVPDTPDTSDTIAKIVTAETGYFPAGMTGSQGHADTAPSGGAVTFSIKKNDVEVATAAFSDGVSTCVFSAASAITFSAGSRISIVSPAGLQSMADISFTLKGYKGTTS